MFLQAKSTLSAQIKPEINEDVRKSGERNESNASSFDQRLEKVEEADEKGVLMDSQIVTLLTSARTEENFAKLPAWLEKIKEEKVKTASFEFFHFQRSKIAIKEERFADARKYAEKVEKIQIRAVLYFDIVETKLKNPQTKMESYESLLEVYKMADKSPDSIEKAQVFLGLAYWYSKFDRFNGLDALSNAVKTANKLDNPNLFSSSVMQQIIGTGFAHFFVFEVPGFDINRTFYEMSAENFQTANGQAEAFSDQYLRTLALLATVKDCEKVNKVTPKQ